MSIDVVAEALAGARMMDLRRGRLRARVGLILTSFVIGLEAGLGLGLPCLAVL